MEIEDEAQSSGLSGPAPDPCGRPGRPGSRGVGPAPLSPTEAGPPKGAPGVPDRKLQKAIDRAIARGAEFLRAQQNEHTGKIGSVFHQKAENYPIGSTALAGLALLAAGDQAMHLAKGVKVKRKGRGRAAANEPVPGAVDKALNYCRHQDKLRGQAGSRTTYDTGVLLMFAAEYYHPHTGKKPGSKKHTVTKKARNNPCKLPEDASAWIRNMKDWLIKAQETEGGWGYPQHREDLSNTQYALLGLRAARDCGGMVPRKVFKRVIERLIATQEEDGPKVMRSIGGRKKGDTIYKIESGDRARGWGYLPEHRPRVATGSMTTSGIGCLAISHDALMEPKRWGEYKTPLENKTRRAIQDGFAWLDVNFTVTSNPPPTAPGWHYYFLYGLERAAMLAGRGLIGEHDWYLEGARYLVAKQQGDGRWSTGALGEYEASDVLDTAWAILFLKKATKPVKPIPGPVITK